MPPQLQQIEYATPNIPTGRGMAWTYAIASAALPFFGCVAILFFKLVTFTSARSVLLLISLIFMSGSVGAMICGWAGRRSAIRCGAVFAGWLALIGMAFGAALLYFFGFLLMTRIVLPWLGR